MATKAEPVYEKFVDADGVPYPTDKKFYRAADESIFTEENQKYQVWQNKANAEKAFPGVEIKEFIGNEIEHPIVMDKKNKEQFATGGIVGLGKTEYDNLLGKIKKVYKTLQGGIDKESLSAFTIDRLSKLVDAGYSDDEIISITLGYTANHEIKCDGEMSIDEGQKPWPSGLSTSREESIDRTIDSLVEQSKNNTYELGLKYPNFNWAAIIKKYKISTTPKHITIKNKWNNSDDTYEIFVGDNVVIGHKVGDGVERANNTGKFNKGYWGVVSHDKKVIEDIAKRLTSQKSGYLNDISIYINDLGGIDAKDLSGAMIKYAKGGNVEAATVKDELVEVIDILNAWDKYANLHSGDADDIDEFNSWLNKEHAKLGSKEKQKAVKEFALLHPQSDEYATGGDIENMDYYAVKYGSGTDGEPDVVFVKQQHHQTRPDKTLKVLSKKEYEDGIRGFGKLYSSEYADGGAVATQFDWKGFNLNQLKEYLKTFDDINIAFLLKNAQSGGAQDKWAPDSKQFIEISEGLFNVPNQSKVQFTEGEDGYLYVEIGVYPKEFGFNDLYLHRITLSSKDNQNGLRELAGDLIQFEDNGNLPELATGGKVDEQKIGGRGFSNYVKGRRLVPADIASLPKGTIVLGETTQFGGLAQNAFKVSKTAEELSEFHPGKNILYLQYIVSPNLNEDIALWDFELKSPRAEFWLGVKKKAKKHEAGGSVAEERILKFIAKDNDAADIFAHECKDNNYSATQDGLEFSIVIPEGKKSKEFKDEVSFNTIMRVAKGGKWIVPEEKWHGLDPGMDLESNLIELGFIARKLTGVYDGKWEVLYRLSDDEFALAKIEESKLDAIIKGESLLDRDKIDRYLEEWGLNKEEFINSDFAVKFSDITLAIGSQKLIGTGNSHIMDLAEVKEKYLTVPHEETEDELENGGHPKKTFWIKEALVHKGTLRKKAKEMGLIKDDEPLTLNDVAKIEKLGGVWIKKCQLARRLMSMHKKAEGGVVDPKLLAFDDLTTAEKEEVNRRKLVVGEPCKIVNKDGERVIFGEAILKGFERTKDLYGVLQLDEQSLTSMPFKIKFLVSEDRPDPEAYDLSFLTTAQISVVNEILKKLENSSNEELESLFKNAFDITEKQAKFIVSKRFNPATEAAPTDLSFLTDDQLEVVNCILSNDNLSCSDDELVKTFKYGFDITDKQAKHIVSFRKEFFLHPGENFKLKK